MQHRLRGAHLATHRITAGILVALVVACVLATTLPGMSADWAVAVDDIATIVSVLLAAALSWLVVPRVGSTRES